MKRTIEVLVFVVLHISMMMSQDRHHRIAVRVVENNAQLYDTETNQVFVRRGVNDIDWRNIGGGIIADRVFDTNWFDLVRVRDNFRLLADHGYNTVRFFFNNVIVGLPASATIVGRA